MHHRAANAGGSKRQAETLCAGQISRSRLTRDTDTPLSMLARVPQSILAHRRATTHT